MYPHAYIHLVPLLVSICPSHDSLVCSNSGLPRSDGGGVVTITAGLVLFTSVPSHLYRLDETTWFPEGHPGIHAQ